MALRLAAVAAGRDAARAVHALSGDREPLAQLLFDAEGLASGDVHRPRQLSRADRRPDLLAGAVEQPLVRARHDPAIDRARAADGGMGEWPSSGTRVPAARLLHTDGVADDRRREHLALLLYAGIRTARAGHRALRIAEPQLARQPEHGFAGVDGRHRVEGGGLFHDLLPRGAAIDVAASGRRGGHRRRVAKLLLPPGDASAADADDA